MSTTDCTAGEIDWPAGFERTDPADRVRTSKFSVTFHDAISELEDELLERVDADDVRISTAAPHRKSDGRPYADANPDEPSVVVRWTKDGDQYAVACDHYTDWRDNARAIGLYVREKRKMASRPVVTGQDEFATARLPSGDEDAIAGQKPPNEVLGVEPDADPATVREAFRERAKETHADVGGSSEAFKRVKRAKEAMLS
ncbi:heat shock protein DnaJ domain protein [Halorhabdus tiamatea SARL4B]|uniref:Heat shock protein DnaJ domain protein n=1 Tax=Halorhabdus tiamatea SARL4B TaxID=1033806 RepID=F7PJF8_9EURY|nr:J domain-containing protein [Halorhabdus tiamatea]ERJ05780.1 heat shock protein DnaJ domain protein [Halorhabdus tiamatea SARL4B]CCQ34286.1 heat shock protein DnaJ domain protein [Halorhabdus tiamatea SARL4B]